MNTASTAHALLLVGSALLSSPVILDSVGALSPSNDPLGTALVQRDEDITYYGAAPDPQFGDAFDQRWVDVLSDTSLKRIDPALCDQSGEREANVIASIGAKNSAVEREYYAVTNDYGQVTEVLARDIVIQDESTEPVNDDGRYCDSMADVPGVGARQGYDRGHVIADSLGGEGNAYNITPQNAALNRHGDQAYFEHVIRQADGASDFHAVITYPDEKTQVPDFYKIGFTIDGEEVMYSFANADPELINDGEGVYTQPYDTARTYGDNAADPVPAIDSGEDAPLVDNDVIDGSSADKGFNKKLLYGLIALVIGALVNWIIIRTGK